MAMHARPVPIDPYNPAPPVPCADGSYIIRHPSPFIPIRLPIFSLVLWLNDCIIWALNVGSRRSGTTGRFRGRHKSLSESVESVEEGQEKSPNAIKSPWNSYQSGGIRESRRKVD
jgi:etoposide-induced 2.4 mRNA